MKTKLENKVREFLAHCPATQFRVMAHELWRDGGSWTSNDRFCIARGTVDEIIPAIVARWEVFKINYSPRATVKSIIDGGWDYDSGVMLEAAYLPFVDIEADEN